jgi:hypothetical protein
VGRYIEGMENEARDIRADVFKMIWHMRGGINLDQAMLMTYSERQIVNDIIKENLETTKKTGLPFF